MTRQEMQTRWTTHRALFHRTHALVDGVKLIDQFLADLATVEQTEADTVLTLAQAATRSGYSVDHLARLIRQGRLTNVGRRGAPRLRVADLPLRRGVATHRPTRYDVNADARAVKDRRQ